MELYVRFNYLLGELENCYNSVLLSYGAEEDRLLGVPGEELKNVIPGRNGTGTYFSSSRDPPK